MTKLNIPPEEKKKIRKTIDNLEALKDLDIGQTIINITVLLFPDGQTYWSKTKMGREHFDKIIKLWHSKADKKYDNNGLSLCWAELKMFEYDYNNKLCATSKWIVD